VNGKNRAVACSGGAQHRGPRGRRRLNELARIRAEVRRIKKRDGRHKTRKSGRVKKAFLSGGEGKSGGTYGAMSLRRGKKGVFPQEPSLGMVDKSGILSSDSGGGQRGEWREKGKESPAFQKQSLPGRQFESEEPKDRFRKTRKAARRVEDIRKIPSAAEE